MCVSVCVSVSVCECVCVCVCVSECDDCIWTHTLYLETSYRMVLECNSNVPYCLFPLT